MAIAWGFLLFFSSVLGYVFFLNKKLGIKIEFTFIVAFSAIITVLFLGSILNLLPQTANALLVIGVIFLFYYLYKAIRGSGATPAQPLFSRDGLLAGISNNFSWGIILFIVATVYFYFFFQDAMLYFSDNYSHWALIVKSLLIEDHLPNYENIDLFTHASYPPGTALFLYYFIRLFPANTNALLLLGQMFLMLASLMTIFAFFDNRKKKNLVFVGVGFVVAIISLLGVANVRNLCVDTLLPIYTMGSFALILYYSKQVKTAALCSIPILTTILLIKSSGTIFAVFSMAVLVLVYFGSCRGEKGIARVFNKHSILPVLGAIALPFFCVYLWDQHLAMVFSPDQLGKHVVNMDFFSSMYHDKMGTTVSETLDAFKNAVVTKSFLGNRIMVIWNIVAIIAVAVFRKKGAGRYIKYFILIDVMYVAYLLGLLGMYVFSMEETGAVVLSGFERYVSTIYIFINGCFSITLFSMVINSGDIDYWKKVCVSLVIVLVMWFYLSDDNVTLRDLYAEEYYDNYFATINQTYNDWFPNDYQETEGHYIIFETNTSDDYDFYSFLMAKYKMYNSNFYARDSVDLYRKAMDEEPGVADKYHDVIIISATEDVKSFMKETYGLDVSSGIYSIK